MLQVVDRRTVRGRRDYAILLLLVTYGLRAHEVVKLTLDDFDWQQERFQVPARKAGHWSAYPLANVVAEAIIDYLQHGRPQTTDRHLFFRVLAPHRPITNAAVSSSVADYLRKAGIHVHRPGAHTLRHTCVQRLIDAEFPLKTIGDYVGHRSPQSTEIYSKVALPDTPKGPQRALVYETVFALLYGLGLRVGEVARLTVGDVDFTGNILCIRETKFSKNRWVPFGPNMANRLRRYCDQRYGETAATETPLFSFTQGRHIHPCTISQTFHKLLPQLELQLLSGVAPPRVHDLRHSFAVGTLLRWYREGVDPNRRLIHLATFLGHVDPNSTAVYLTITDELLREAAQRFHAFAQPGRGKTCLKGSQHPYVVV